jgi:hypothetical protein
VHLFTLQFREKLRELYSGKLIITFHRIEPVMFKSTSKNPLIHFERFLGLITYGIENTKTNNEGYKASYFDVFHNTAKNYNRIFFGGGNNKIEMHCVQYNEDSKFIDFPFISKKNHEYYQEHNWKKLFTENDMISKMPHDLVFLQLEFKNPFLVKNAVDQIIDMVYSVGVFAKNITINGQPKIAIAYGLLHVSSHDQSKLDYDILHSMHLVTVTNKKCRVNRSDFAFNVTEHGDEPVSELENFILTRLAMFMVVKKNGINQAFVEGVFKTSKLKGNC